MVNYKNGKIYKLCSLISDKIYIGSTCQPLSKRFASHKAMSKKMPERPVYKHINKIGWQNYNIILVESFPCNNKEELEKQERYYIETLRPKLNGRIPTRTRTEYYADNKRTLIEKCKTYKEQNKEKIIKIRKLYNDTHKQEIKHYKKEFYENNKEKIKCSIKQYNQDNKQQISEHKKQYRERNKEKIRFKKSIYYLQCKLKKLITDCNDISKEHDDLINKFNLIH